MHISFLVGCVLQVPNQAQADHAWRYVSRRKRVWSLSPRAPSGTPLWRAQGIENTLFWMVSYTMHFFIPFYSFCLLFACCSFFRKELSFLLYVLFLNTNFYLSTLSVCTQMDTKLIAPSPSSKKCPSFMSSSNLSSSSVPFASAQSLSHLPPSLSPFSRTVRARHGAQPTSAVSRQHAALWRSAVVSEPENPGAERTAPRRGVVGIPAGRMGKGANRFGMFFLVLFFLLFFCFYFTFII